MSYKFIYTVDHMAAQVVVDAANGAAAVDKFWAAIGMPKDDPTVAIHRIKKLDTHPDQQR